jgi:uncharacterized protein
MSDPHRLYEIRCPVHRFVTINDWEREIINQPAFQRLRRIRQLAWTDHAMNAQERWLFRLAVLSELVERAPGRLGRTAIMKLAYFLQAVKEVPLGYNFRLYTYGPYDSAVLTDLSQAEAMRAIKSKVVPNPSGYGYEFEPGPKVNEVKGLIKAGLTAHESAIRWVVSEFSSMSASDLELVSTILYADREAEQNGKTLKIDDLCLQVSQIKPRFALAYIRSKVDLMMTRQLLRSTTESGSPC